VHKMQNYLRQKSQQAIGFGVLSAVVLVLDQLSKSWALDKLVPGPYATAPKFIVAIPGMLRFQYAENRGVAFSLLADHPEIITGVALLLSIVLFIWAVFFLAPEERATRLALGLIFGGAIGNLVDRFQHGFVVDFIVAHWGQYIWPTFNIADAAICLGIGVFFIASLMLARQESLAEKAKANELPENSSS
jgi:signal peptidase II